MWPPLKPRLKRAVAVPSSTFSNLSEPARTFHVALLARAVTIFRVEEVAIYQESGHPCAELKRILDALEVPQYLRKYLVPRSREYRYLGLVPPLRSPSHLLRGEESEYREGYVVSRRGTKALVDVGLGNPVEAEVPTDAGRRVTLRREGAGWRYVSPEEVKVYWGYRTKCYSSLREALEHYRSRGFLLVGTSRKAAPVSLVLEEIKREATAKNGVAVFFGTWNKGLQEISEEEGFELESFLDFIVNTAPIQGVKTIRTEEAVYISLAILNLNLE
ncbi:putative RNA uridine N3 methyltransferase [Thermofilum pendens]|uniref:RNA-binding protein n=1 Tax=Thermofilum pendens (strain DSM 2475 / Hrk 5) TaxID=368408 RepID=A1RWR1_THEPD|nr:RNA methyltransferase [Thermofilum pendens]ABL77641.1 Protein of unknown function DUF171 [Thermofilum pendens Hrk 5]